MAYKIVRHYFNGNEKTIETGLTFEQAQKHCKDLETSSSTCTNNEGETHTEKYGKWFDGYTEE